MKNKECMNCGSTKFHQVENGWKCDYCGTLYLNPQKNTTTPQSPKTPERQQKNIRVILGGVLAVIFILAGPLGYLSSKITNTNTATYKPIKPGTVSSSEENEFPGEWTQSIYESVKVATENYDADSEKYSFTGGSSYEELEKLVGPPDTITSWEKEDYGMPPRAMATWNKTKDGKYTPHAVTIHYEKKTLMITDKDHR
ncbi:hypothetical protein IGI39_000267 [Enterococcus sp. AZ135]|uniref:hypothetical protein n=1 Tax=unclassified Enterococcus TaxID=2608891 RepID=UPI003F28CF63